jgi:RimK family alpha-L-glutamate ligase
MRGRVGIVGWRQTTNEALAEAWQELGVDATLVLPGLAMERLAQGDVALARLDVLVTLDGIEPGIEVLAELSARGVRVLNGADALLGAHDKLETAARLQEAGLPHPLTSHVLSPSDPLPLAPPVVVKPRFGSWGVDVLRCETESEFASTLELIAERPWFRKHGAIVQELVPPAGYDLRLVVAGAQVVGAAERVAHPGEWRTNVSLGGTRRPASPSAETQALGIDAARAIGADFVGIDLLPTPEGYVVLELNGAVEFDRNYDLNGADVYDAAATALDLPRTVVSSDTAPIRLRWP